MTVRATVIAVAIAGLSLAAAGCSSGSGSSSAAGSAAGATAGSSSGVTSGSSGSGSGSGSTGSSATGPSGQLTGTELTKALLPSSAFPASFAVSQQGSADSGGSLEKTAASYDPATIGCTEWDNYFTGSGFGETAFSADSVASTGQDQSYGQVVYQFGSAGAASRFFTGVRSLPGRCRSFTASGGGSADRVTMQSVTAPAVDAHQAFGIDQATTVAGATSTIDTLFALDGTDVLAISASGVGSAPPSSPAPAALLAKLISSVQARH
jgi:hypothetical protein